MFTVLMEGTSSLQRLEEFSSFQSCIKFFGKSILPPLVTAQQKNDILKFQAEAVNKEADIAKRRKERLNLSQKIRAVYDRVERVHNTGSFEDVSTTTTVLNDSCALSYTIPVMYEANEAKSCAVSSELPYMAISKIPSDNAYSVVHKSVITCSKITSSEGTNGPPDIVPTNSICPESDHEAVICNEHDESYDGLDTSSNYSQTDFDVPYVALISDESNKDNESVIDTSECYSSPKSKQTSHDTDCESSSATCTTYSTDLEKYLDCSIEASVLSDSFVEKDKLPFPSCSDEGSSSTIVNTENELTPVMEFMEMSDYEETFSSGKDILQQNAAAAVQNSGALPKTYSFDSYMKILNTYSKNISNRWEQHGSLSDSCENPKAENSIAKESVPSMSQEIPNEENESQQNKATKRHVRSSSYTLDYPSSALIQAHGKCKCDNKGLSYCASPHCSSIRPQSVPVTNTAFIKEKVQPSFTFNRNMKENVHVLEAGIMVKHGGESQTAILHGPESKDVCFVTDKKETSDAQTAMTPDVEEKLPKMASLKDQLDNLNLLENEDQLAKIYHELQINHKRKVEKLLEEQQKQWVKLQEEFKEEEKLLCEKLGEVSLPDSEGKNKACADNVQRVDGHVDNINAKVTVFQTENREGARNKISSKENHQFLNPEISRKEQQKLVNDDINCNATSVSQNPFQISNSEGARNKITGKENHRFLNPDVCRKDQHKLVNEDNINCNSASSCQTLRIDGGGSKRKCSNQEIGSASYGTLLQVVTNDNTKCKIMDFQNEFQTSERNGTLDKDNKYLEICNKFSSNFNKKNFASQNNSISQASNIEAASLNLVHADGQTNDCVFNENEPSFSKKLNSSPKSLRSENKSDTDMNVISRDSYHAIRNMIYKENNSGRNECSNSVASNFTLPRSNNEIKQPVLKSQSNVHNKNEPSHKEPYPVPVKNIHFAIPDQNSDSPQPSNHAQSNRCPIERSRSCDFNDTVITKKNSVHDLMPLKQVEKMPVTLALSCIQNTKRQKKDASASANITGACNSDVLDPVLKKKFERLPALVKGYLTRRLFQSERVQGLLKVLKDTVLLMQKLDEELAAKKGFLSEQDVDLRRQLLNQLMTTFHNLNDIFCKLSIKEQMRIIAESRRLQKQKLQNSERDQSVEPEVENRPNTTVFNKKLSSATRKVLERKMRPLQGSKIYSVDDFRINGSKTRCRSCMMTKSQFSSSSPHRPHVVPVKRKVSGALLSPSQNPSATYVKHPAGDNL